MALSNPFENPEPPTEDEQLEELFQSRWIITNVATSNSLKAFKYSLKNQKFPPTSPDSRETSRFFFYPLRDSDDPSRLRLKSWYNNYITIFQNVGAGDPDSDIKPAGLSNDDSYIWSYSIDGDEFVFSDLDGYYLCSTNSTTVKRIIGNREFSDLCKFRVEIADVAKANFGGSIPSKYKLG